MKSASFILSIAQTGLLQKLLTANSKFRQMKKILLIAATAALMCSCAVNSQMIIPKAVNTVGTASFSELRLERADYNVIGNVVAEASISYATNRTGTNVRIKGIDEDFDLHYFYNAKRGWSVDYAGVVKFGYLSNDYLQSATNIMSPEDLARGLAIYRAINKVRAEGGDGLIEPTISTSVEQTDSRVVTFKSVVTAKIIRLKSDNELER